MLPLFTVILAKILFVAEFVIAGYCKLRLAWGVFEKIEDVT